MAKSPSTTNCRATRRPRNTGTAKDQSKKSEETNNYEISRVTKTEVTEAGRVNRISVAVLVDGSYSKNEKGEQVYAQRFPRKNSIASQRWSVRPSASTRKRGDQVEVVNLKFAEGPTVVPTPEPTGLLGMMQFTKDDVMHVIELAVMMLLGLVVMFMVIRPLVRRVLASEPVPALPAANASFFPTVSLSALTDRPSFPASGPNMIDVATIQGQVHAQSVHRVGELADRNPNETAAIVRAWLQEPA